MTIGELQEKKRLLESTLLELIQEFEDETTCCIEKINLMRSAIVNQAIQVICEIKI